MNIIAICGSPRKGNTEFVLRRFLIKAEELGHKTDLVLLREKKIGHCNSCFSCNDEGVCNLRDDMGSIIERMMADDLIIFGSPNYFNNVTGLMKDFMDRLQPLRVDDKLSGKKAVAIMVGEEGDSKSSAAIATMTSAADLLKMAKVGDLYLVAKKAQDVETNPESLKKIDDFATSLLT